MMGLQDRTNYFGVAMHLSDHHGLSNLKVKFLSTFQAH